MSLYLPVHPHMHPCLKKGIPVVHNGSRTRQGWYGKITAITGKEITVAFANSKVVQSYSWDWFKENFYINATSAENMRGFFKGSGFVKKYAEYELPLSKLKTKAITHKEMKLIVDAKLAGATPVLDDPRDPLDEVGEFILLVKDGVLSTGHKTQRIAEMLAAKHTKEKRCWVGIMKLVAESKPRCEADIIRK